MSNANFEVTGRYVDVDGTRTYYDQCGTSGPTLICIHTAAACSMQYYDFIQIMAKRGFRAIAIDLPGHGKSYPIKWQATRTAYDYAEFVWKFAKLVSPDAKPIICGSSVGGVIALHLTGHHSDGLKATLVLEGLPYADGEQFSRYCKWWEHPHSMPGWQDVMERAAMSGLHGLAGERLEELRWQHRYCAQEVGTGDLQCWATNDARDVLKNITCPILAFKGEADYWVPESALDYIVANVPDGLAEKAIGPNMGHYPMFEQPEALADIAVGFLKRRNAI